MLLTMLPLIFKKITLSDIELDTTLLIIFPTIHYFTGKARIPIVQLGECVNKEDHPTSAARVYKIRILEFSFPYDNFV